MRLMGVDYGEKRVGIASTDDAGEFAIPRTVLPSDRNLLDNILALADEWNVEGIVLGESKKLDGTDNPLMESIRELKRGLENRGKKVFLHTEVFSSLEAERLQGKNYMLDASAAAIILKSYLDTQKNK